jgi:Na+-transporting NADH:ubiquinone oxidoreductase subunit NqrC
MEYFGRSLSLSLSLSLSQKCTSMLKQSLLLSAVILQVLKKDNYVDWSVRVKNYLMAHHLWEIIEETTQPPMQEDDEAAFKAWTKKNSMALHVIQISCGPDSFSEIIGISSAKVAWDSLAKKFLHIGLEKHNYVDWSVRVKTYLVAHHLWEIIEATTQPPRQEDDEVDFKAWSKKNSMALHVIQISCGPDSFSKIIGISSAKVAWDSLVKKFLHVDIEKHNYVDWSVRVKTYLVAHHLWEIIEATTQPPRQEDDEVAFKAWSKKNSMALHVIQISCGPDSFSEIIGISSAKVAWDTLGKKFNSGLSLSLSLSSLHMLKHSKCIIRLREKSKLFLFLEN